MCCHSTGTPEEKQLIIELLQKQMVIADKIEHELEMTATSGQFGDLVTQLLAQMRNKSRSEQGINDSTVRKILIMNDFVRQNTKEILPQAVSAAISPREAGSATRHADGLYRAFLIGQN